MHAEKVTHYIYFRKILPMSATNEPGSNSWRNWDTFGQGLCRLLPTRGAMRSYTLCTWTFSSSCIRSSLLLAIDGDWPRHSCVPFSHSLPVILMVTLRQCPITSLLLLHWLLLKKITKVLLYKHSWMTSVFKVMRLIRTWRYVKISNLENMLEKQMILIKTTTERHSGNLMLVLLRNSSMHCTATVTILETCCALQLLQYLRLAVHVVAITCIHNYFWDKLRLNILSPSRVCWSF